MLYDDQSLENEPFMVITSLTLVPGGLDRPASEKESAKLEFGDKATDREKQLRPLITSRRSYRPLNTDYSALPEDAYWHPRPIDADKVEEGAKIEHLLANGRVFLCRTSIYKKSSRLPM